MPLVKSTRVRNEVSDTVPACPSAGHRVRQSRLAQATPSALRNPRGVQDAPRYVGSCSDRDTDPGWDVWQSSGADAGWAGSADASCCSHGTRCARPSALAGDLTDSGHGF